MKAPSDTSVIKYTARGNNSIDDTFARTKAQGMDPYKQRNSTAFIPEVEGKGFLNIGETQRVTITNGTNVKLFRLGGISTLPAYEIDYIITRPKLYSNTFRYITVIREDYSDTVSNDEYTFQGTNTYDAVITFTATISD